MTNKCSRVVVDYRIAPESRQLLEKLGYTVILTKKINNLYSAVDGHTDMQIFVADDKIIVAAEVYEYYSEIFTDKVICGEKKLQNTYPYDIQYNAAYIDKFIICNKTYTSPQILEFAKNTKKTIIDVKQGYSKCSVGIIGKNAIVTADNSIAEKCRALDIDVLEIQPGHIKLAGMDYGFIGGTCGMIADDVIAFNGELSTHPAGNDIKRFCNKHKIDIVELKKGILEDIGSISVI